MDLLILPEWDDSWSYSQKKQAVWRAQVRTCVWCFRCDQWCQCVGSDVDTSGPPCKDFSFANRGRQGLNGPWIYCLLAWCRFHRCWQTPIIIHENVPQCVIAVLIDLMGDIYDVISVPIIPGDVGFQFAGRKRLYIAMVHKRKATILHDIGWVFAIVSRALRNHNQARLRDALLASREESIEDAEFVETLRKLPAQARRSNGDCTSVLNPYELRRLRFPLASRSIRSPPF